MKHEEWNRRKRNARETVVELGVCLAVVLLILWFASMLADMNEEERMKKAPLKIKIIEEVQPDGTTTIRRTADTD